MGPAKEALDKIFQEEMRAQREIIQDIIETDNRHLILVNFCIDPFRYGSFLHNQTGYLFVRVEPFYGRGLKDFDITIYNKDSKALLLVECKSSVYDGQKEVDDLLETISAAEKNHQVLEDMIGDEIKLKEFAICSVAGHISRLKPAIVSRKAPICLWFADIFTGILSLEKMGENASEQILCGMLHRDGRLRDLLLKGVQSVNGPTRFISFLPSSHPCTILEEICTVLHLDMEKSGKERFRFSDLQNLLEKEISLRNFSAGDLWNFAHKLLKEALEIQVFQDQTPNIGAIRDKEFQFAISHGSPRAVISGVKKCYMDFHAKKKAEQIAVGKFRARMSQEYGTLNGYR